MTSRRQPDAKALSVDIVKASELREPPHMGLLSWEDLPDWRRDNHYILNSYRPTSYSYFESFGSLFYLHNEFFNIHSHLSATLLFLLLAAYLYLSSSNLLAPFGVSASTSPSGADILAFGSFFTGAVLCLGISAAYHTISNHSPLVNQWGNQLDYVGIVVLITGSFVPSVYYGFYCDPYLQKLYWTMISSLGIACTTISVAPKFRSPVWRPFRAAMFAAMGLSAVFPVLHGLKLYGVEQMNKQIGLSWLVAQGLMYILGAVIYAVCWAVKKKFPIEHHKR